jgi:putative RNA 2'-phosphotransferase
MNEKDKKRTSKFLSLILRHEPGMIGLQLDDNGWANVEELIMKSGSRSYVFSKQELEEIVVSNDKQRFSFNEDKTKVRASQGHSIDVELQLDEKEPPESLYHGTVEKFLQNILTEGLCKMARHHVHLSKDIATAETVARRRGKPVVLSISSGEMYRNGFVFYLSDNGVWLTDHVPVNYINYDL